jgi:hypothetical protein
MVLLDENGVLMCTVDTCYGAGLLREVNGHGETFNWITGMLSGTGGM